MKILAIDTSGQQAAAAIVSEHITVGEIFLNARTGEKSWSHSEILMPGIDRLFSLTGVSLSDIDVLAYTCGPGSFTGLRIGAATALGMARALNLPAVPVPTLDALAYNAAGLHRGGLVVPMLDARRGQIYTAVYECREDGKPERRTDYMALHADEFLCYPYLQGSNIIFLGDGADANAEIIRRKLPFAIFALPNDNRQRAASVGIWAAEKIKDGYEFPEDVDIIYVRAPQAVREKLL